MPQPIIEINGLGKKYRIGALRQPYLSLRDELAKTARHISSAFSPLPPSIPNPVNTSLQTPQSFARLRQSKGMPT